MAANAAQREVEAQVIVPLTATTVTSVSLTATGTTANLRMDPTASARIAILASTAPIGAASTSATGGLPVFAAPNLSTTLNPGGNASGLFPTLNPGGNASGLFPTLAPQTPDPRAQGTTTPGATGASQVANNSALSEGSSTLGAQVAGLAALALAGVFAVTRISIRRPTPSRPDAKAADDGPPPPKTEGGAVEDAKASAGNEAAEDPPADPET